MLKVNHIRKCYGDLVAVDDLSFEVGNGEIFGLLGENGAGKTTTFRVILGLLEPNEGSVTLDNEKIDYKVSEQIGFVTEERSLLTKLSVQEMIEYYGTLKGMNKELIENRLNYWLDFFEISNYKFKKIKELSKGNQQKIQFISSIINEPKLLILDEPFTGLDPINVEMMKKAIKIMQEKGCSIIFSSHQMEYIEDFCEKLVILVKGKSILNGSLKDIKKEYAKKNIVVSGDLNVDDIKKIKGVLEIEEKVNEIVISIENEDVADKVFAKIKDHKITKYVLSDASLSEVFIHYVGGCHE